MNSRASSGLILVRRPVRNCSRNQCVQNKVNKNCLNSFQQKILFQSKQANTDIHYDPKTIQEVFLHTIYQGLGSKHTDIRQQLRPLPSNNQVTDEDIVSQVMKILSDHNEQQLRTDYGLRQKATHSHSVRVDDIEKSAHKKEHQTIQQLSAQVETLTNMVAALMDQQTTVMHITHPKSVPVQMLGQPQAHRPLTSIPRKIPPSTPGQPSLTRKGKIPICTNCLHQGLENCNHCFVCGDPGHRAVGCLKRARQQENGNRPLLRDGTVPEFQSHPITHTRKQRYSKRQRCDKRAAESLTTYCWSLDAAPLSRYQSGSVMTSPFRKLMLPFLSHCTRK